MVTPAGQKPYMAGSQPVDGKTAGIPAGNNPRREVKGGVLEVRGAAPQLASATATTRPRQVAAADPKQQPAQTDLPPLIPAEKAVPLLDKALWSGGGALFVVTDKTTGNTSVFHAPLVNRAALDRLKEDVDCSDRNVLVNVIIDPRNTRVNEDVLCANMKNFIKQNMPQGDRISIDLDKGPVSTGYEEVNRIVSVSDPMSPNTKVHLNYHIRVKVAPDDAVAQR